MSAVRPSKEQIFTAAADISDPAGRAAYLDAACGDDQQLRAEIEDLLRHDLEAGSFLDAPAPGLAAAIESAPLAERPGTTIGRYKLLEEIGEGGMGVVYMAEQREPVRRKVALKIIKPGMDTREVIARFEAERQALAMMDHPNIAHVLDGGATESGRPYFVMELVQGIPITEYCDQAGLTTRKRLELFVQVCQAVQHAHQKGIIHRDLKPSNVLVTLYDGVPVPKIIDFGIAKAIHQQLTEKSLFTGHGRMMGTPMYMSPEQAEMSGLDVDTRSDIYSLGVLLYELLTGSTPFDRERLREAGFDEIRRVIREEEPPRPSHRLSTLDGEAISTLTAHRGVDARRLGRLLRGDLDWIVMKALEKDRTLRYESASALAADVERYLADEPVQARPPTLADRAAKWGRRHKAVIWAAALLLVIAAAASAAATALVWRQKEQTEIALHDAEVEAARANAVIGLVQQMLSSASPYGSEGKDYTVRQLLDEFSVGIGDRLKGQPEVEATVRALIGKTYAQLLGRDEADVHLRAAIELYRKTLGNEHEKLADCLIDHAFNLTTPEGTNAAREALSVYRRLDDPTGIMRALWVLHCRLIWSEKRYDEADRAFEEAAALAREHPADVPKEFATMLHNQAAQKRDRGELREAEALGREAVALHRRVDGEDHPELAWGLYHLAKTLMARQDPTGAESCFRESLAIFHKRYGQHYKVDMLRDELEKLLAARGDQDALERLRTQYGRKPTGAPDEIARLDRAIKLDPNNAHAFLSRAWAWHARNDLPKALADANEAIRLAPKNVWAYLERGQVFAAKGDFDRALADYDEAIRLDPKSSDSYVARGRLFRAKGDLDRALADFEEAVRLNPTSPWAYHCRGWAYRAKGQLDKALADLDQQVRLEPKSPSGYVDRGQILVAKGDRDKALADFNDAIRIDPKFAPAYHNRGLAYGRQNQEDLDRGLRDFDEAIRLDPKSAAVYADRGSTYQAKGDWGKALADFSKAVELEPKQAAHWRGLVAAQYRAGQWKAALQTLDKAMELRSGSDAFDWFFLAMAHWQLGHKDEARKWYEKGVGWMEQKKPDDEELRRFRAEAAQLLAVPEEPSARKEKPQAK